MKDVNPGGIRSLGARDSPPEQGKGWGGAVLEPELRNADRCGLPCYLETTKPRNIPFYERAGFAIKREVAVPGGGPPLWTMIREPVG